MIPTRRTFLAGLGAALSAPAVIRTPELLMPVRSIARSSDVIGLSARYPGIIRGPGETRFFLGQGWPSRCLEVGDMMVGGDGSIYVVCQNGVAEIMRRAHPLAGADWQAAS